MQIKAELKLREIFYGGGAMNMQVADVGKTPKSSSIPNLTPKVGVDLQTLLQKTLGSLQAKRPSEVMRAFFAGIHADAPLFVKDQQKFLERLQLAEKGGDLSQVVDELYQFWRDLGIPPGINLYEYLASSVMSWGGVAGDRITNLSEGQQKERAEVLTNLMIVQAGGSANPDFLVLKQRIQRIAQQETRYENKWSAGANAVEFIHQQFAAFGHDPKKLLSWLQEVETNDSPAQTQFREKLAQLNAPKPNYTTTGQSQPAQFLSGLATSAGIDPSGISKVILQSLTDPQRKSGEFLRAGSETLKILQDPQKLGQLVNGFDQSLQKGGATSAFIRGYKTGLVLQLAEGISSVGFAADNIAGLLQQVGKGARGFNQTVEDLAVMAKSMPDGPERDRAYFLLGKLKETHLAPWRFDSQKIAQLENTINRDLNALKIRTDKGDVFFYDENSGLWRSASTQEKRSVGANVVPGANPLNPPSGASPGAQRPRTPTPTGKQTQQQVEVPTVKINGSNITSQELANQIVQGGLSPQSVEEIAQAIKWFQGQGVYPPTYAQNLTKLLYAQNAQQKILADFQGLGDKVTGDSYTSSEKAMKQGLKNIDALEIRSKKTAAQHGITPPITPEMAQGLRDQVQARYYNARINQFVELTQRAEQGDRNALAIVLKNAKSEANYIQKVIKPFHLAYVNRTGQVLYPQGYLDELERRMRAWEKGANGIVPGPGQTGGQPPSNNIVPGPGQVGGQPPSLVGAGSPNGGSGGKPFEASGLSGNAVPPDTPNPGKKPNLSPPPSSATGGAGGVPRQPSATATGGSQPPEQPGKPGTGGADNNGGVNPLPRGDEASPSPARSSNASTSYLQYVPKPGDPPGIKIGSLNEITSIWEGLTETTQNQLKAMGSSDTNVAWTAILGQGLQGNDLSKIEVPVFQGINNNSPDTVHFSSKPIDLDAMGLTEDEQTKLAKLFQENRDGVIKGDLKNASSQDKLLVEKFREKAAQQLMQPYQDAFHHLNIA